MQYDQGQSPFNKERKTQDENRKRKGDATTKDNHRYNKRQQHRASTILPQEEILELLEELQEWKQKCKEETVRREKVQHRLQRERVEWNQDRKRRKREYKEETKLWQRKLEHEHTRRVQSARRAQAREAKLRQEGKAKEASKEGQQQQKQVAPQLQSQEEKGTERQLEDLEENQWERDGWLREEQKKEEQRRQRERPRDDVPAPQQSNIGKLSFPTGLNPFDVLEITLLELRDLNNVPGWIDRKRRACGRMYHPDRWIGAPDVLGGINSCLDWVRDEYIPFAAYVRSLAPDARAQVWQQFHHHNACGQEGKQEKRRK